MKDVILLTGTEADMDVIRNSGQEAVFVLNTPEKRYQLGTYIDELHKWGLKNKTLSRLRVCVNLQLAGNVSVCGCDGQKQRPSSIAELLSLLDPGCMCTVTIENDDRALLANVVQQLIYIDYPITQLNVGLARETVDQERTERFVSRLSDLLGTAGQTVSRLNGLEQTWMQDGDLEASDKEDLAQIYAKNREAYAKIEEELRKARKQEVKVAVAASKKTGKSTIVNSMIGVELAPTSLELATPNSCIYRKSSDQQYHLRYGGQEMAYDDRAPLTEFLRTEFRRAEKDAAGHYTIPDMEIGYVSNKNNFEAYTIYDTPGPDLAGTEHSAAASQAIEECDVALFAIDFAKYLTTTEEEYLSSVKTLFDHLGKIHTLLFTINKMDMAFEQKEANSRVKTIDRIRSRLAEIDPSYAHCVIFATSAQDYFNTVELGQAAEHVREVAPLLTDGANWLDEMPDVLDQLDEKDADDALVTVVTNLNKATQNLRFQLKIKQVDAPVIQEFSGMPQLMRYMAYIAQSKAREEILNGITYTVASLVSQVSDVSQELANIRATMDANQDQIDLITSTLNAYADSTRAVLMPDKLTAYDDSRLGSGSVLAETLGAHPSLPADLSDLISAAAARCVPSYDRNALAECLWPPFREAVVGQLKAMKWVKFEDGEANLSLSDARLKAMNEAFRSFMQGLKTKLTGLAQKIAGELSGVLDARFERVSELTDECRKELEHEDITLQFPASPAFQVALSLPKVKDVGATLNTIQLDRGLSSVLEELWPAHHFFRNIGKLIQGDEMVGSEVQIRDLPRAKFYRILDDFKPSFLGTLQRSGVFDLMEDELQKMTASVEQALKSVLMQFSNINRDRIRRIEAFKSSVDDRERYKDRLAVLEKKEDMVRGITDAAKDFLTIWQEVTPAQETAAGQ